MAEESFKILQNLRNRIDTAESAWLSFAEASTQAYNAAYKLHTGALNAAKLKLTAQAEEAWKVFSIMLAIVGAPWAPRLLEPMKKTAGEAFGVDELLTSMGGRRGEGGRKAVRRRSEGYRAWRDQELCWENKRCVSTSR